MTTECNTKPINSTHSISEVVFVLQFTKYFGDSDYEKLISFEDKLKDQFSKMEKLKGVGFKLDDDGIKEQSITTARLMGLKFSEIAGDGSQIKMIRAEKRSIIINCYKYSRWSEVWRNIRGLLEMFTEQLISPQNPINSLALTYQDQFLLESSNNYDIFDVFNPDTQYLNKKVLTSGPYWHLHQGWFDTEAFSNSSILNILNINAASADKEHKTTIEHRGITKQTKPFTNVKTLFEKSDESKQARIDNYFELLHDKNKELLNDLLSNYMTDTIELNK